VSTWRGEPPHPTSHRTQHHLQHASPGSDSDVTSESVRDRTENARRKHESGAPWPSHDPRRNGPTPLTMAHDCVLVGHCPRSPQGNARDAQSRHGQPLFRSACSSSSMYTMHPHTRHIHPQARPPADSCKGAAWSARPQEYDLLPIPRLVLDGASQMRGRSAIATHILGSHASGTAPFCDAPYIAWPAHDAGTRCREQRKPEATRQQ
jgi:hypothetical protein